MHAYLADYKKHYPLNCMRGCFCSSTAEFSESDVQRSSSATPSNAGNGIDYSFYVTYQGVDTPMAQHILASVVNIQLDAMQAESTVFFSLQTSFQPPPPVSPNSDQGNNTVEINIINQQADQVC